MKSRFWRPLCFTIVLLWANTTLFGQIDTTKSTFDKLLERLTEDIDSLYMDYAVPDLNANSLLDVDPDNVQRPGDVKDFVLGIRGISADGKIAPGFGMEFSPGKLCRNGLRNIHEYENNYWLKDGFQVSLATNHAADGANLGVGISMTFKDESNPLLNHGLRKDLLLTINEATTQKAIELDAIYRANMVKLLKSFPEKDGEVLTTLNIVLPDNAVHPINVSTLQGQLTQKLVDLSGGRLKEDVSTQVKELVEEYKKSQESSKVALEAMQEVADKQVSEFKQRIEEQWNKSAIRVSAAWVFNSSDTTFNHLQGSRVTAYFGMSGRVFPNNKHFQGIVHAQGSWFQNPTTTTAIEENFTRSDSLEYFGFIGLKGLLGNSQRRFTAEFGTSYSQFNQQEEWMWRISVGGEIKVSEGLWIEIATGTGWAEFGQANISQTLLGNVKYSFGK